MPATSLSAPSPGGSRPTGSRRLNLYMLTARDRADSFTGLPAGTAKPYRLLAAFQEAEPYLGLPSPAYKLISWLVKQTKPQDWEEGSRPIAWPSARRQQEFLALSPARVKSLNRILFEAGIFVIRDNEQGKRYGRRGPDGRIIEAYGFDLSPLAQRYDEFVGLAAAARVERDRMKALRRRVTLARRAVRQTGEALAATGNLPTAWPSLAAEVSDLVRTARQAQRSEELALVAKALENRKAEAEQWLRDVPVPAETDPTGLENKPHAIHTNLIENPYQDTVIAHRGSSQASPPATFPSPSVTPAPVEQAFRLKAAQLVDLAPKLARYMLRETPTWPDIVEAAATWLRPELGVSPSLWGEACRIMGRDTAALALAIVSTKQDGHFSSSAGGYFAGMVRKAEKGELHLERTLWALREAKWGKPDRRRGLN
jgi:replication initiation protein RepC